MESVCRLWIAYITKHGYSWASFSSWPNTLMNKNKKGLFSLTKQVQRMQSVQKTLHHIMKYLQTLLPTSCTCITIQDEAGYRHIKNKTAQIWIVSTIIFRYVNNFRAGHILQCSFSRRSSNSHFIYPQKMSLVRKLNKHLVKVNLLQSQISYSVGSANKL